MLINSFGLPESHQESESSSILQRFESRLIPIALMTFWRSLTGARSVIHCWADFATQVNPSPSPAVVSIHWSTFIPILASQILVSTSHMPLCLASLVVAVSSPRSQAFSDRQTSRINMKTMWNVIGSFEFIPTRRSNSSSQHSIWNRIPIADGITLRSEMDPHLNRRC